MGTHKGMRWHTAIAVVTSGVEAHIAQKTDEVARGHELLSLLGQINPPADRRKKSGGGGRP